MATSSKQTHCTISKSHLQVCCPRESYGTRIISRTFSGYALSIKPKWSYLNLVRNKNSQWNGGLSSSLPNFLYIRPMVCIYMRVFSKVFSSKKVISQPFSHRIESNLVHNLPQEMSCSLHDHYWLPVIADDGLMIRKHYPDLNTYILL